MDSIVTFILPALVGLVVGILIGNVFFKKFLKSKIKESETNASLILKDAAAEAESIKKSKIPQNAVSVFLTAMSICLMAFSMMNIPNRSFHKPQCLGKEHGKLRHGDQHEQ